MNPNTTVIAVVPRRRPMFTRDWTISKQLTRWVPIARSTNGGLRECLLLTFRFARFYLHRRFEL